VHEVEWERDEEPEWEGEDDPLTCSADAEEVFGQRTKSDGLFLKLEIERSSAKY
jgi:hypothetical protein